MEGAKKIPVSRRHALRSRRLCRGGKNPSARETRFRPDQLLDHGTRSRRENFTLAQEHGIAVIVNRPFGGGDLFSRVRGKPLPDFAADFDCTSWAQFLLKWIVAHPAVTCAIPATNNVLHLEDNMRGAVGRLPAGKTRAARVDA